MDCNKGKWCEKNCAEHFTSTTDYFKSIVLCALSDTVCYASGELKVSFLLLPPSLCIPFPPPSWEQHGNVCNISEGRTDQPYLLPFLSLLEILTIYTLWFIILCNCNVLFRQQGAL